MKIAIVCLEFARAQRMRSLAEGLTLAGHEVVFITSEFDAEDPRFRVVGVPFRRTGARVKAAAGLEASANLAEAARRRGPIIEWLVRTSARAHESLLQHPDKYRGWIGACRRWLASDPIELRDVDILIATSPPVSALYCGLTIARHARVRAVFDFRDLWTDNPYYPFGRLRKAFERSAERWLIAQAVALTSATETFQNQIAARYPGSPARAIYTAVDPTPWLASEAHATTKSLRVGHFGTTYAGLRSIQPLIESLGRLAEGDEIDISRVSLELFGDADESTFIAARDCGLGESLNTHGWIPPSEVPAALGNVDIALLLAWPEDVSSVPLKTYHYLAAGKTILVLGAHPESEMRRMLEPLPGVDCPDTPAELDTCVLRYWEMVQARADFSWSLDQRPMPVTRESMTAQFLEVIRQAASDQ